jgi:hypothetical protein
MANSISYRGDSAGGLIVGSAKQHMALIGWPNDFSQPMPRKYITGRFSVNNNIII